MIIIFDDDYYLLTKPQAAPWSAAKSCQVGCKHFNDGRTIGLNMMVMVQTLSDETKISIETHIETFFLDQYQDYFLRQQMVMIAARSCQVSWIDFSDGQIELPTNLELISVNCGRCSN